MDERTAPGVQYGGVPADHRPLVRSLKRGLFCRCPNCGNGRLFVTFLKPVARCSACDEDYTHQRADDLPAYLVIFLVGHVMMGGYMSTELLIRVSPWVHLAIWTPLAVATALITIQPIKGAVIGLQWANRMHGFGGQHDEPGSGHGGGL